MTRSVSEVFATALAVAIPKGGLSISEWAETYRYVSPMRSARPGRWSNDVIPFGRGIMDAVTQPDVRKVVFMKSSQVGGTELLINILCYYIMMDPSLMLYIAEIEDKARAWTNEAFDPTIAESPAIRECFFGLPTDRNTDNNQRIKRFRGGQLTIGWASSPAQLSSRPARIVAFDEVDAFEPTAEGDAIALATARTKTFGSNAKIILVSSPRNRDTSIIEREYMAGDQREYHVPCPHCDELQVLKWANVHWDDPDDEEAYYVCDICGAQIDHDEKAGMLARGTWIAKSDFHGTASFRINEIYSPFTTWGDMKRNFLMAKRGGVETLRVFVNTSLGETWAAEQKIEYADLQIAREEYEAEVPDGVLVLTAAVDVQGDRLECEIVGWGRGHESWSIDYSIIEGSPALPDVWDRLSDYLTTPRMGRAHSFVPAAVCIDSGGHHTQQVYRFCKANSGRKWFPVKGSSTPSAPLISKPKWVGQNPKVRLYLVGTNAAKDEIFEFLRVAEPGMPGFCHFPADDRYDDAYLRQLCAEKKVPRFRAGREVWVYEKVSPSARNEALDLRVYNTAARAILNPNYDKIAERLHGGLDKPKSDKPTPPYQVPPDAPRVVRPARRFRVKNNPFRG
jgi:phage terminase large subunit GpA-like protein